MVKKIDGNDKKIGKVSTTSSSEEIKKASEVSKVSKTKATEGVKGIKGTSASGKVSKSNSITTARRAELFSMIEAEAEKIFGKDKSEKREIIEQAVKMAIDAAMTSEEN